MSWEAIIDQMKEWVQAQGYLTTSYIERENWANFDFAVGHFNQDGNWHELDLSAIVPAGASAVNLHLKSASTVVGTAIRIRRKGSTSTLYSCVMRIKVALIWHGIKSGFKISTDRKIEYMILMGPYTWLYLTVHGWWL